MDEYDEYPTQDELDEAVGDDHEVASGEVEEPTLLGIPLNRIVAFVGPHVAWLSGVIATWLLTNVHVLSLFKLDRNVVAAAVAQVLVFAVVTGVTWLGQQKWLQGYQKWAYEGRPAALVPAVEPVVVPVHPALVAGQTHPMAEVPYDPESERAALDQIDTGGLPYSGDVERPA